MSKDAFELVYDGTEIREGEMDVYALAPALIAMGDLFRDADVALNGFNTTVTTSVKADFREGSFEILMSIEQHLRDPAVGLIPSMHLIGADQLIATVVGEVWHEAKEKVKEKGPEVVKGLFKLIGKLAGEKPKEIRHDESTNTSIYVLGNNNTIKVDQSTSHLYENPKVVSAASRVASPLRRKGINDLRAKKGASELVSLTSRDFPELNNSDGSEFTTTLTSQSSSAQPQVMIVKLIKPSFSDDKWSVSDGGKPFSVMMDDLDFKAKVHSREIGFFDGDLYRVQVVTSQKLTGKKIQTTRRIVKVLEPVEPYEQVSLELPEVSNSSPSVLKPRRRIKR